MRSHREGLPAVVIHGTMHNYWADERERRCSRVCSGRWGAWKPTTEQARREYRVPPDRSVTHGKEEPIGVLLADVAVEIGHRPHFDLVEDFAECLGERGVLRI